MRIDSSQQMFQHIESGGTFKLNQQGQLETQSAAGRFFQKIGDAFRSLSASGRAAIETRNANLYAAMANLVRADNLINPAQADIPRPEITQAQRNIMAMNLAIGRELAQVPAEAKAATRAYVTHQLKHRGILEQSAETVRAEARQIMRNIQNDPVLANGLKCAFSRTSEELQPLMNDIARDFSAEFQRPTQQARIENGIHESYILDALRNSVHSINGQPPNMDDLAGQLTELVPNEKIRAFISMAASQAGLEGSMVIHLSLPNATNPNPNGPDLGELQDKRLNLTTPHHSYDMNIENGRASIRFNGDLALLPMEGEVREFGLGGTRYAVVMDIDLTQDMTGKAVPDFTLRGECSPIDPDM